MQLCLFVMDTHRLPKNLSRKLVLETLRISPFKSICMVVTVMSGFNSELYSRNYNRVSFIILVKITLILRAFVFLIIHVQHPKNAQISILLVPRVLFEIISLKQGLTFPMRDKLTFVD